jgi:hypothetical protein
MIKVKNPERVPVSFICKAGLRGDEAYEGLAAIEQGADGQARVAFRGKARSYRDTKDGVVDGKKVAVLSVKPGDDVEGVVVLTVGPIT